MAKASDNEFPSVLFGEQAADVATPGTGLWRAFFKSDGLYVIDDAGSVVGPLAPASGGGGGGGRSYITDPALKPPDTAHGSDLEFNQANGTNPATSLMSWGNQGAMSAEIRGGRLWIGGTGGNDNPRGLFVAAPSGDFTVTTRAAFAPYRATGTADDQTVALAMLWGTLATPTEINLAEFEINSGALELRHSRWSGYSTFGAVVQVRGVTSPIGAPVLKLAWDSVATQVSASAGVDPAGYALTGLGSDTTPTADPDFVGVVVQERAGVGIDAFFDFLRFNWTPDFDPTTDD